MRLIFDAHGDLALYALAYNRDQTEPVAVTNQREAEMEDAFGRGCAANSLPEMRRGGVAVCQSSLAVRVNRQASPTLRTDLDFGTQRMAYAHAQGQLAYYRVLEQQGEIELIHTASDLDRHWSRWEEAEDDAALDLPVGIIVSMECADPIVDPAQAQQWWNDGLRSVMLSHFGHSQYAAGTGVTGPLTARGVELLAELQRLEFILDLSHLSEQSFHEALDRFSGPVIASHNNCRDLVPGDRQLSDEQLALLIDRGGVIGAVLDAWMLVPGWVHGTSSPEEVTLEAVADHIDHVCQLAGNSSHAAIGSDIGGTNHMPHDFQTTADLQKIGPILAGRGYSPDDLDKIFHRNWLEFFRRWLPRGD
ncbi:MAG: membrane dipeptidase [Planctomycetaceae bacterium]